MNADALRQITDDTGGRTEIVRGFDGLDAATARIADELSKQVLPGLLEQRREGRPLARDPRGGEGSPPDRPRTPRIRRVIAPVVRFLAYRFSLCVSTFFIALGLSLLGGLGGLLVASGVLLINDSARARLIPWLVSYAVGALLGVSMLAILPERSNSCPRRACSRRCSLGILLFFVLEKLVLWRHCHTHDCEVHDGSVFPVLVGDAFHNFVDGAVDRRGGDDVGAARRQHGASPSPRTRSRRRSATSPSCCTPATRAAARCC